MWLFCYVLLVGFGVKAIMLCPGIFSPYPHFRRPWALNAFINMIYSPYSTTVSIAYSHRTSFWYLVSANYGGEDYNL